MIESCRMYFVADYRLSDYERAERMKGKKTEKQILDAIEQCAKTIECGGCPYIEYAACKTVLIREAHKIIDKQARKIEDLEERIAIMTEGGE